MSAKRILLMTTAYGPGRPHAPLVESLADLLAGDGHDVRVVAIDWSAAANGPTRRYREESGAEVLLMTPREVNRFGKTLTLLSRWTFSSFAALRTVRRELGEGSYDLTFVMTPAVTLTALILWAKRRSARTYAYITDFFPFHHASIGLVPNGFLKTLAHRAESALLRTFDVLAVMSPLGATYLRTRYRLHGGQQIEVLRLWALDEPHDFRPREEVRRRFDLPSDRKIAVFSGQITSGKGIEDILAAARLAAVDHPEVMFLLIGSGRLEHLVREHIAGGGTNVTLREPLPRADFLDVLSACDAGLVATVPNVDVPTFPSKTIDYLKAGLPIVASVEASTDFGTFVNDEGFGIAVEAGNPGGLLKSITAITGDEALGVQMRTTGRATHESVFGVRRAANQLLERVSDHPLTGGAA